MAHINWCDIQLPFNENVKSKSPQISVKWDWFLRKNQLESLPRYLGVSPDLPSGPSQTAAPHLKVSTHVTSSRFYNLDQLVFWKRTVEYCGTDTHYLSTIMNRIALRSASRGLGSLRRSPAGHRCASSVAFNWEDPLNTSTLFTEDEIAIQETARSYCQERMLPRVLGMNPPPLRRYTADRSRRCIPR
jgi:hypothetical protein